MNIFIRELQAYWKTLFLWAIGVAGLIVGGLSKYQGFAEAGDATIKELLEVLPERFLALFGGKEADLTNILTFYAVLFLYLAILAAAHAALLGSGILYKEERDKTTEFLYVKPRSRNYIITQKLAAASVLVVALNLIIFVLSIVFSAIFGSGQDIVSELAILSIGLLFIQFIFLGIGMMCAAVAKSPKLSAPLAAGIVMTTFILSVMIDIINELSGLKYFTPFKYFDAKVIAIEKQLDPVFIGISIILIGISIVISYFAYNKRDLEV